MKLKLTVLFLLLSVIISILGNFINTAVISYYFLASGGTKIAFKSPIAFDPHELDVKKLIGRLDSIEFEKRTSPAVEDILVKSKSWLQVIDEKGKEINSINKPDNIKSIYTQDELNQYIEAPESVKNYRVYVATLPQKGGLLAIGKKAEFTYVIGTPKPRLTVFTFFYGLYNYLTSWNGPDSIPKLVSMLLTLVVVLLLGYFFAQRIAGPVADITKGMTDMSEGNYNMSFKEKGLYKDVYRSLNNMSAALRSSEAERKRTEKLREDWIVNLSHDLKTPLSSIKGYGELMLEPGFELTDDERRKCSEVILDKSAYMECLLEDLKLTQKLKNELLPLNREQLDLVELVRDVVIDILNDPKYANRQISFETVCENIVFTGDRLLLKRALTNIIYNAVVHNPEDTEIIVMAYEKAGACVEVSDNGRGIPSEDQKDLFERYYRGTSTESGHEGSGLGLAIARQIVEAHKGRIALESEPGEGTKVIVAFP